MEVKIQETESVNTNETKKYIEQILNGKLQSKDIKYDWVVTPNSGWMDAIYEARGHGVSNLCFGDTLDKIVLHPGHLGYKFNYYWGKEEHGLGTCWGIDDEKKINEINKILIDIAKEIHKKDECLVQICFPSGSHKGHLSTTIWEIEELDKMYEFMNELSKDNLVLFVYSTVDLLKEQFSLL